MKDRSEKRPATIEEAVRDSDPFMAIESLIDEQSPGGRWFRLMFASILEVNSAGPGILLDRFAFSEVTWIASEYARIGADQFAKALGELITFTVSRCGEQPSEDQIIRLSGDPEFEALDRRHTLAYQTYRDEMERTLLAHIAAHPEQVR